MLITHANQQSTKLTDLSRRHATYFHPLSAKNPTKSVCKTKDKVSHYRSIISLFISELILATFNLPQ